MPFHEYFFTEPAEVLCVKVKVPVVLVEEEAQVMVDNITVMPELVRKVDHINVSIMGLQVKPVFSEQPASRWADFMETNNWDVYGWQPGNMVDVLKKVEISGTLHKQIFYVDKNDNVRHFAEDISFAKTVDVVDPVPVINKDEVYAQVLSSEADIDWDLVNAGRLHQTGRVIVRYKVVEDRQIYVQACPMPVICPPGNLIQDPSFEAWTDENGNGTLIFWGASNIFQSNNARSGSFSVGLGEVPGESASVFQSVRRGIRGGNYYQLCFYANEVTPPAPAIGSFTLEAAIVYYDAMGVEVGRDAQTFSATQIPNGSWGRFCVNSTAPANAANALVRFNFLPVEANASQVLLDDVELMCIR